MLLSIGTSGQRSSQSAFAWSNGNDVSGHNFWYFSPPIFSVVYFSKRRSVRIKKLILQWFLHIFLTWHTHKKHAETHKQTDTHTDRHIHTQRSISNILHLTVGWLSSPASSNYTKLLLSTSESVNMSDVEGTLSDAGGQSAISSGLSGSISTLSLKMDMLLGINNTRCQEGQGTRNITGLGWCSAWSWWWWWWCFRGRGGTQIKHISNWPFL